MGHAVRGGCRPGTMQPVMAAVDSTCPVGRRVGSHILKVPISGLGCANLRPGRPKHFPACPYGCTPETLKVPNQNGPSLRAGQTSPRRQTRADPTTRLPPQRSAEHSQLLPQRFPCWQSFHRTRRLCRWSSMPSNATLIPRPGILHNERLVRLPGMLELPDVRWQRCRRFLQPMPRARRFPRRATSRPHP